MGASLSQDRPGMTTRGPHKRSNACQHRVRLIYRRLARSSAKQGRRGVVRRKGTQYSLFIVSRCMLWLVTGLELSAAGDLDPDAIVAAASVVCRSWEDWVGCKSNSGKCDERDSFKRYRLLRHLRAVSCRRLTRDSSQPANVAVTCWQSMYMLVSVVCKC